METSQANDQAGGAKPANKPSIDSLRTVEFRTTLRGYHMDDVDEYLERVAVEAEALQEQMRLATERMRQASDRVSTLEQQLEQARRVQHSAPATELVERVEHVEVADDSLQRTLVLAQKFVDQTRQQAEEEATALVAESESRARSIVADAEEHARVLTENAERTLRDEVKRLDAQRSELVSDVETIARHLETERTRIRKALTDMVAWVDDHVQPPKSAGSHLGGASRATPAVGSTPPVGSLPTGGVSPGGSGPTGGSGRISAQDRADQSLPSTRPVDDEVSPSRGSGSGTSQTPASTRRDDPDQPGQPTERIQMTQGAASSRLDPEDPADLLDPASPEPAVESATSAGTRSTPGHQRQMFAPGRDSRGAGRAVR